MSVASFEHEEIYVLTETELNEKLAEAWREGAQNGLSSYYYNSPMNPYEKEA